MFFFLDGAFQSQLETLGKQVTRVWQQSFSRYIFGLLQWEEESAILKKEAAKRGIHHSSF